jgi:hypothetical protein
MKWRLIILSSFFSASLFAQTPSSRELVYCVSLINVPNLNPGLQFGLEYGIVDKVNFINGVSRGKKSSYNLTVNQFIVALNAGTAYRLGKSTDVFTSLTAEFRRTTPKRNQFQLGLGPGYVMQFYDNKKLKHPLSPFLNAPTEQVGFVAPMAFIGLGKYRTGKHKFQFWHLRAANYFLISGNQVKAYPMLELRLSFHKRPIA